MSPVYLFYPNLIGYLRILAAIGAFAVANTSPYIFFTLYAVSQVLDAFDGHAARYFNQCHFTPLYTIFPVAICRKLTHNDAVEWTLADTMNVLDTATKFGAVLDMVTDRASTACLWVTLAQLYPEYVWAFQAMLAVDIMSHFARLVATSGNKSHKDVSATTNIFLKHYYGNKFILFILCAGHEGAFLLMYFLAMLPKIGVDASSTVAQCATYALWFNLPLCAIKEWMNLVQFWQSMVDIVEVDDADRRAQGLDGASVSKKKVSPSDDKPSPPKSPRSPKSPKKARKPKDS